MVADNRTRLSTNSSIIRDKKNEEKKLIRILLVAMSLIPAGGFIHRRVEVIARQIAFACIGMRGEFAQLDEPMG